MANKAKFLHSYIDQKAIKLVSVIGAGSYGVVYKGQYVHEKSRYCAVKCIEDSSLSQNEIDMHMKVTRHPSILAIEKIVKERGQIFMIMEYAEHGDLFSSLTNPHGHDEDNTTAVIRYLFLQILEAVNHCHYNFVAHRDIKPQNILILPNNRIKLADFGFATTKLITNRFHCGSSSYMSPECHGIVPYYDKSTKSVKSHNALYYDTHANDVWSLGITLINIVFKKNPWSTANLSDEAFVSYVKNPHQYFSTVFPTISSGLEYILLRIFELDASKRITLSKLKSLILGCKTFTTTCTAACCVSLVAAKAATKQDKLLTPPVSFKSEEKEVHPVIHKQASKQPVRYSSGSTEMAFTHSFTNTVLAYIDGFEDWAIF